MIIWNHIMFAVFCLKKDLNNETVQVSFHMCLTKQHLLGGLFGDAEVIP